VGRYISEGIRMLQEGVPPAMIDNAARLAGMPVGPLTLNDEVAIDLSWKIVQQTQKDLGDKYEPSVTEDTVKKMVDLGRFGRKAGKGFYDYPAEGKGKSIWPGLKDMFSVRPELAFGEGEAKNKAVEELKKRLLYVQAVDAARCLEEGVL